MPEIRMDITSVNRSRADAKDFYNRISKAYDTLAASEKKYIELGLDMLAAREGERVLEVGSGTGHALARLAQEIGETGHVYGIDIAPGMIDVAKERLQNKGLAGHVSLIRGDAVRIPYCDRSLEGIFISFTLELFQVSEISIVLEECKRVLKDGGRMCVVSLAKDKPLNIAGKIYEWLHTKFPKMLDCRPIPVQSILTEAGFQVIDHQENRMWGLPVSMTLAKNHPV